jgi:hypothetical protein
MSTTTAGRRFPRVRHPYERVGSGPPIRQNAVPDSVAGYGQGEVTGATVTDIDYTPYASDNTDLGAVVFNSSTDVTGKTATLTLKSDATTVLGTYTCSLGAYAAGTMDITCDTTSDHPDFDAFSYVGLTVVD